MIYMTNLMKKYICLVASFLCTSGCANVASDYLFDYYFGNNKNEAFVKDYNNNSEYSFAYLKFGRFGAGSILVLAYIDDGIYEWRSSDGISVFTSNGMVVKTLGLGKDYKTSLTLNPTFSQSFKEVSFTTLYEPSLYSAKTLNEFTASNKPLKIDILDQEITTSVITHKVEIPIIRWNKENKYFINSSGRVIKAEVYIHPYLPRLTINYFYK